MKANGILKLWLRPHEFDYEFKDAGISGQEAGTAKVTDAACVNDDRGDGSQSTVERHWRWARVVRSTSKGSLATVAESRQRRRLKVVVAVELAHETEIQNIMVPKESAGVR